MKVRNDRRAERQQSAIERQAAREARGDAAQLAMLEKNGHGNCREANRLRAKLAKPAKATV